MDGQLLVDYVVLRLFFGTPIWHRIVRHVGYLKY